MVLTTNAYVTLGLSVIIFTLLFRYYWTVLRKIKGFPVYHIIYYVILYQLKRKKDASFSSYILQSMLKKLGEHMKEGLCMTYLANPVLFIFAEDTVKAFLNENLAVEKHEGMYIIIQDLLGAGLVTSNGEKWKKHRKMLNPAFSLGMLKDRVSIFNEHASALVKDLTTLVDKPSSDPLDLIRCNYFNSLSESVFGFKQSEENRPESLKYFHLFNSLAASTVKRMMHPWLKRKFMLYTFSHGRKILQEYKTMHTFTENVISKMKEHITTNQAPDAEFFSKNLHKSFAYILLQQHLNDPSFTAEDVHGEVNTFLNVGYENVSVTTMWCLFMLGLYPEVQEKAFNEVQSVEQSYISFDDCSNFTYLESVIMETLRLYPTIPIIAKRLCQDMQCGQYRVPKNTVVVIFLYLLHRNPDIYPEPENFEPERFLGDTQRHPWTHLPFSEGNRSCLGRRFALLEMKIFLAYILRNFKITSLDKREDVELSWSVLLLPAKPLRMRIEPRAIKTCSE